LRAAMRGIIKPPEGAPAAYLDERYQPVCFELSLGDEIYISARETPTRLADREAVSIAPGEFAIITTAEQVQMPQDKIGFISMKFGFTQYGLINVSGFHVDPGFVGKIHFAVYHAGPTAITLRRLDQVFMLFLASITDTAKKYEGKRQHQDNVPTGTVVALKGPPVSLKSLDSRLTRLESSVRLLIALGVGVIAAVVGALLTVNR